MSLSRVLAPGDIRPTDRETELVNHGFPETRLKMPFAHPNLEGAGALGDTGPLPSYHIRYAWASFMDHFP